MFHVPWEVFLTVPSLFLNVCAVGGKEAQEPQLVSVVLSWTGSRPHSVGARCGEAIQAKAADQPEGRGHMLLISLFPTAYIGVSMTLSG